VIFRIAETVRPVGSETGEAQYARSSKCGDRAWVGIVARGTPSMRMESILRYGDSIRDATWKGT
jgi:hypothetical protein